MRWPVVLVLVGCGDGGDIASGANLASAGDELLHMQGTTDERSLVARTLGAGSRELWRGHPDKEPGYGLAVTDDAVHWATSAKNGATEVWTVGLEGAAEAAYFGAMPTALPPRSGIAAVDGQVYVATTREIAVFSRTAARRTVVGGDTFDIRWFVVDGDNLIVTTGINLLSVTIASGAILTLASVPAGIEEGQFCYAPPFAYVGSGQDLVRIELASGQQTVVASVGAPTACVANGGTVYFSTEGPIVWARRGWSAGDLRRARLHG